MAWGMLGPSSKSCYLPFPLWETWAGLLTSLSLSFLTCEMGTNYPASRFVEKIQETVCKDMPTLGA